MNAQSFFIAGTMQGSRNGSAQVDQSYRKTIANIVTKVFPSARINCPASVMAAKLGAHEQEIRKAHERLAGTAHINTASFDQPLQRLTSVFHELVDLCANSDICIAYLPGHEASMGTAAEMFAARRKGKPVIAITEMTQNLAVMSCATLIIPSIEDLESALASFRLPQ